MEEKKAFSLVTWLPWVLMVILIVATTLDLTMAIAYLTVCHPWREILAKESQVSEGGLALQVVVIQEQSSGAEGDAREEETLPQSAQVGGHTGVAVYPVLRSRILRRPSQYSQS